MAVKTKKYDETYDSYANGATGTSRVIGLNNVYSGNTGPTSTASNNNNIYVGGSKETGKSPYSIGSTGVGTTAAANGYLPGGTKVAGTAHNPTELTAHYRDRMLYTDANGPGKYTSRYDDQIQGILDTIYNRKAFNINDDANYQQLYDNYKERYTANAQRAMADSMASANAMTGGYGSTYGQIAGQQAYDQTMEGLNDRNIDLMNLAYQMYGDEFNRNLNTLGAFQGQDQIEYGRHRDDVNDWQLDRNYYADRYDKSWQTDYTEYQNALGTAMQLSQKGLPVPDYLTAVINRYNGANGLGSGDYNTDLSALAAQLGGNGNGSGKAPATTPKTTGKGTVPQSQYMSYLDTTNALANLNALTGITEEEKANVRKAIANNSIIGTTAKSQSTYPEDYLYSLAKKKFSK